MTIGADKTFTFDFVFDTPTAQPIIYDKCVRQLVEGTFDGYNATVLAYGQVSIAGMMLGSRLIICFVDFRPAVARPTRWAPHSTHQWRASPRIRALYRGLRATSSSLLTSARSRPELMERSTQCSRFTFNSSRLVLFDLVYLLVQLIPLFQLYNEDLIDLLAEERYRPLKIQEDPFKGEIYLKGVTNVVVTSPEGIMRALKRGSMNRTTAATNMNLTSSRSHAIFTVFVKQERMVVVEVGFLHCKCLLQVLMTFA